jgi:hypothetical protein
VAVAYVSGSGDTSSVVSSLSTGAFTVGSETDKVLVALIHWNTPAGETLSNVVWDAAGVNEALTKVGATFSSGNNRIECWRKINPSAGTSKVVTATWSGSTIGSQGVGAALFSGADQTTPVQTPNTNNASSASPTVTISTAPGVDDFSFGIIFNDTFSDPGVSGTGHTSVFIEGAYGWGKRDGSDGSTLDWTLAGSAGWFMMGARIINNSGGGGASAAPNFLTVLGAGA